VSLLFTIQALGFQLAARKIMKPAAAYDSFAAQVPPPTQVRIPTEAGPVTAHVYHPATPAPGSTALPVYINFHGGGFTARYPQYDAHLCRTIADEAGCVVVNVDYDVAPQRRFPVAANQAYGVTCWVAGEGAAQHGWDGTRIALGGQSAGGNLAASACLRARDDGGFKALLQVLVYPPLDLAEDPGLKHARADKPLVAPGLARAFNYAYVKDPAARTNPLASPLLAADLSGLPAALVVTAELDLLRDEGDRYAERLRQAGVPVDHYLAPGVDHAFTHVKPTGPTRAFLDRVVAATRSAFASPA
jgi:acetyl esterase